MVLKLLRPRPVIAMLLDPLIDLLRCRVFGRQVAARDLLRRRTGIEQDEGYQRDTDKNENGIEQATEDIAQHQTVPCAGRRTCRFCRARTTCTAGSEPMHTSSTIPIKGQ